MNRRRAGGRGSSCRLGRRRVMGAVRVKGKESAARSLPALGSQIPRKSTSNGKGRAGRRTAIAKASAVFRLAGDVTRLNLLLTLADGERGVSDLRELLCQSQPAIGHHMAMLRHGGLIQPRRHGRQNLYSLTDRGRSVADGLREILPTELARPVRVRHARAKTKSQSIDRAMLEDVGGFVEDPARWFNTPNPDFEGRKPVELLGTTEEPRLRNRIAAARLGLFS